MSKTPQRWLSKESKSYWRRLNKFIDVTDANVDSFALLCDQLAMYRAAAEKLDAEGLTVTSATGNVKQHPAVAIKIQAAAQIERLLKLFGLGENLRHPDDEEDDELDEFIFGGE